MSPKKEIREVSQKSENFLSGELIEINFDEEIYQAILDYKKHGEKKDKLDSADKVLLKEVYETYKDMGFFLQKKDQEKLKKINKKISKLSSDFSMNVNNHKDKILLSKNETNGLSKIFLNSLKKEKEKFVVSLDYPEIVPFMETSENEKKRKELLEKESKKGGRKNLKILDEILKLRKEKVEMLGYKSYPDYITKDRMAKKGENIEKFFTPLLKKIEKKGGEDLKILESFKQLKKENKKEKLFSHDIAFYQNILQKEKFNLDEEKNKEFFQLEIVKKEMMEMFGKLFGFQMKKNDEIKLWHKDVELYDIFEGSKKISHIIFDLFPRDGKYGHAAM
jgi:Zn-dependent oligopeptidase